MAFNIKISTAEAFRKLQHSNKEFISLFAHGTLEVEIYKPAKIDNQKPHDKDEVYVIVSGSGDFYCDAKRFHLNQVIFYLFPRMTNTDF